MTSDATMRLSLFVHATGHHQAAWRHPRADADAGVSFEHYKRVVQRAEAAGFDAVFFADTQAIRRGAPEVISRISLYMGNFEPLTLIGALSAVTTHIGFIATASAAYNYPFQVARKFASLDFISGGRVGWNVVASEAREAASLGRSLESDTTATRYERAAEFVEICVGLWDSWEDDAFIRDRDSGIYVDTTKMHILEYAGKHFSVTGPLNVPRSPQGRPLLVQAGASPTGVDFASRFADMVFVSPQSLDEARETYATIKRKAAEHGRDPSQVNVMPGLVVTTGPSTDVAQQTFNELQELLHIDVAINVFNLKVQGDVSAYPVDEPLPEAAGAGADPTRFALWRDIGRREGLTLGELARRASASLAGLSVCGSGEEIADLMAEWHANGAADGFNVQPTFLPGGLDDFVDFVVPRLKERGLIRDGYVGKTLREHFGLPRPAWRPPGSWSLAMPQRIQSPAS